MSYFKQLRRSTNGDSLIKELSDELKRYQAEQGIEDVSLLRQMRVDTDNIAYTDTTGTQTVDGDLSDTDSIALTDTSDNSLVNSGAFIIAEYGDGTDVSQEAIIAFSDIGGV